MEITYLKILILAVLQGACELLPVSSSAHVIIAEKLMGLDPSTPDMTLLLVMLHTGTMFAVIIYFWRSWQECFFASRTSLMRYAKLVLVATFLTGIIGLSLKFIIEKVVFSHIPNAEVELLFGNMGLIATALAAVGLLIIYAGNKTIEQEGRNEIRLKDGSIIGIVQGLCLPFRGFSRSGATISTGLLLGINRIRSEEFSFALAVVLTPPVVLREVLRMIKVHPIHSGESLGLFHLLIPSMVGMIASFISGLMALKWLSHWLENGRWKFFGYYCLALSLLVVILKQFGI
jgi:undecaprenyl-diphosphatase